MIFQPTPVQTRARSNVKEKKMEDIIKENEEKVDKKGGREIIPQIP